MENDVAYVLSAGIGFLCGEVRVIILVYSGMQTEKVHQNACWQLF